MSLVDVEQCGSFSPLCATGWKGWVPNERSTAYTYVFPDLTDADIAAVNRVLATPYLSIGPQMEAFEWAMTFYSLRMTGWAVTENL